MVLVSLEKNMFSISGIMSPRVLVSFVIRLLALIFGV